MKTLQDLKKLVSRHDLIMALIDCQGYSEEDLKEYETDELLEFVDLNTLEYLGVVKNLGQGCIYALKVKA
jgi:uncharacterized protein YbgA (DUF1722 family)